MLGPSQKAILHQRLAPDFPDLCNFRAIYGGEILASFQAFSDALEITGGSLTGHGARRPKLDTFSGFFGESAEAPTFSQKWPSVRRG